MVQRSTLTEILASIRPTGKVFDIFLLGEGQKNVALLFRCMECFPLGQNSTKPLTLSKCDSFITQQNELSDPFKASWLFRRCEREPPVVQWGGRGAS